MFQNLSTSGRVREQSEFAAGELGTTVNTGSVRPGNQRTGGLIFGGIITGRTAGTVGISLQGSVNNGSTWTAIPFKVNDMNAALQQEVASLPNNTTWMIPTGPIPGLLRAVLNPSADFDGACGVVLYSAGRIFGVGTDR